MTETPLTLEDIDLVRKSTWRKIFLREAAEDERGSIFDYLLIDAGVSKLQIKSKMFERDGFDYFGYLTKYTGIDYPVNKQFLLNFEPRTLTIYHDQRDERREFISGLVFCSCNSIIGIVSEDFSVLFRVCQDKEKLSALILERNLQIGQCKRSD